MTCPNCATPVTAENLSVDGKIGVCPYCARSLAFDGRALRFATSSDLERLDDGQIKELRLARSGEWRKSVLATKSRLRG